MMLELIYGLAILIVLLSVGLMVYAFIKWISGRYGNGTAEISTFTVKPIKDPLPYGNVDIVFRHDPNSPAFYFGGFTEDGKIFVRNSKVFTNPILYHQ